MTISRVKIEVKSHHERLEKLAAHRSDILTALASIRTNNDGSLSSSPSAASSKNKEIFYVKSHNSSFFQMGGLETKSLLESMLEKVEEEVVEICKTVEALLGSNN